MDVRLLGRFEVVYDGRSVALGGLRQRAVLALLVLQANQVVSVDRLIDDAWGGDPPSSADTTLRGYLSHLRRALDGARIQIEARKPGYVLRMDPEAIDVHRFERLSEQGSAALDDGDPARAASLLRSALELWRGPALADLMYERFAGPMTARLDEARHAALEGRVEADLRLGGSAHLVPELEALVRENPLREGYRGQLMRALHRSGRRAEALRVYQDGRRLLADELGLDPSQALQRLEQAILLQDPALDADAGAPASRGPGNLPLSLTSFVGRQTEIADVIDLLEDARLVTITGAGGSGKTRLATEVGRTLAPTTPDGVWLVELAAVTDPAGVPRAVAGALGLTLDHSVDPSDALRDSLRPSNALVVLDNCEHVLDAVARLIDAVLRGCPRVSVLATSREPIDIPGERAWRIPSLPVPSQRDAGSVALATDYDSVRLFLDRASVAVPGFEPCEGTIAPIVHICRRLDGIPLAIELAAARLSVLSPVQIAARLDDRFSVLAAGPRTALPRQRTLRAAIDWSYDLLSEPERRLFERLAVFAGVFDLEYVENVCCDESLPRGGALDLVAALVNKSLMDRVELADGSTAYRLLESLHTYAAEKLDSSADGDYVRARHAAFFLTYAEHAVDHLYGRRAPEYLEAFERAHDDLGIALEWFSSQSNPMDGLRLATALWPFWNSRYYISEGRRWLDRFLGTEMPDSELRLSALAASADLAYWDDDFDHASAACEAGFELCVGHGTERHRGRLLFTKAEIAREQDDLIASKGLAEAALEAFIAIDDRLGQARTHCLLAMLAAYQGDLPSAERAAHACLGISERLGFREGVALAFGTLGSLAFVQGDLARAERFFGRSLDEFQALNDRWSSARALSKLGRIALTRGDADRATGFARQSLEAYEDLHSLEGTTESLLVAAEALLLAGDGAEAAEVASRALASSRERGFSPQLTAALCTTATIALQLGETGRSDELLQEAIALYRSGFASDGGTTLLLLGTVRARQGAGDDAVALCQEALSLFQGIGDRRGVARTLVGLAEASLARDDLTAAARYLVASRRTRDEVGSVSPVDEADYAAVRETVRRRVGDAEFELAWTTAELEAHDAAIDLREWAPTPAPAQTQAEASAGRQQ